MRIFRRLAGAIAAWALFSFTPAPTGAAPPTLDYCYPAGAQRGTTAEITAGGNFDPWPVKVWVDRPGVNVKVGEKKGQLSVTIAEDAEGGLCWLRVYNEEGATPLRPLLIGTLPETLEVEPNDASGNPQSLGQSTLVNGKLANRGDVDTYSIELRQGQTLVATLRANETLASPMDGVLQIADPRGFTLAQNNDARGLDPMIVFEAPADGAYLVRAFAFPAKPNSTIDFAGGEDYVYRLTITTGPILDHTMPLAVQRGGTTDVALVGWNLAQGGQVYPIAAESGADETKIDFAPKSVPGIMRLPVVPHGVTVEQSDPSQQTPQHIDIPRVVCGTLTGAKEVDAYRFTATKGQQLVLRAESHHLGSPLDPVLEVIDTTGNVLMRNDDVSRTERDARLVFTAAADGEFEVRIRDLHLRGGMRFIYRMTVEPLTPRYQLTLPVGEFTVKSGKTVEISVAVKRDAGFTEAIEVTAVELPQGVSAETVISQDNGETAKEVKLKLSATNDASSGPFRIVGRSPATGSRTSSARFTYDGNSNTHERAWLTVQSP